MKYSTIAILTLSILTAILMHQQTQSMKYRLGLGKIDMTSSIGEINMMGYADPIQQANGILLRLYARSFIIGYLNTRLALVIVDAGMVSATIKQDAINMLNNRLLEEHDDYTYSIDNVMISATHTHSGPGGYMDDFLYHITSLGQVPVIKDAITFAIYESLYMAHLNFIVSEEINIYFGVGNCLNASINRSPKAYQQNPESERLLYNDDVDREMTVLSFRNTHDNRLLGAISWFAVHATSMSKENQLVSGDNKGVASYLWEKYEREQGNSNFVAAFPQSNSGDISPNILGSRCINSGEFCDGAEDDCDGDITKCRSRGPDEDDILSTMIIGTRQYNAAKRILESSKKLTTSNLEFRHVFVNMSDVPLVHEGKIIKTCLPAMGASFAAGTTVLFKLI